MSPTSPAYTWGRRGGGCEPTGPAGTTPRPAPPHPGREPFRTLCREAEALGRLTRKPTEFGFRTDLWAAARVAQLIRERFGGESHLGCLREWPSKRRHTPRRPARRAMQRDPAATDR